MKIPTLTLDQAVISFIALFFNLIYFSAKSSAQIGQLTILQVTMFLIQSIASQAIFIKLSELAQIKTFTYPLFEVIKLSIKFSIPGFIIVLLLLLNSPFSLDILVWFFAIPIYTLFDVTRRQIAFVYSELKSLQVNFLNGLVFVLFSLFFLLKFEEFSSLLILIALQFNYLSYILIFTRHHYRFELGKRISSQIWIHKYQWSQQDIAMTLFLTSIPFFFLPVIDSSIAGEYRLAVIYATSLITTLQSIILNLSFFTSPSHNWFRRHDHILVFVLIGYILNFLLYRLSVKVLNFREVDNLIVFLAAFVAFGNFGLSFRKLNLSKEHSLQAFELSKFWLYSFLVNGLPLLIYLLIDF